MEEFSLNIKTDLKKQLGFTFIEVIVTVAVAAIILSIGVPSFSSVIRNSRLTTNTNELITALHFSRAEAIKRNNATTIKKKSSQWEAGWQVFVDNNGNGSKDSGDLVLKVYPSLPSGFTLLASKDFITFTSQGFVKSDALAVFQLCVDDNASTAYARTIKVNKIGRPRFEKGVDSCS